MSYTQLALAGVAFGMVVDCLVLRTKLVARRSFWTAYAIVLLFQLIVNGVLAGAPVVRYDPTTILGRRLIYAPVEDLLFGFAMVLITLSTWVFLGRLGIDVAPAKRQANRVTQ